MSNKLLVDFQMTKAQFHEMYEAAAKKNPDEYKEMPSPIASMYYIEFGERVTYIDAEGDLFVYEPTDKDSVFRQERGRAIEMLEWSKTGLFRASIAWSTILVTSFILGLKLPADGAYQKKKAPVFKT